MTISAIVSFRTATPLWVAVAFTAAVSLWWLATGGRLGSERLWLRRMVVAATLIATLVGVLMPVTAPAGFVPAIATVNPLLGFEQLLGIDHQVWDTAISQVWAAGNVVLLWPLTVALLVLQVKPRQVFAMVALLDFAIETTQGLVRPLGRSFEVADIVMNLTGVLLLLLFNRWRLRRKSERETLAGDVLENQTRLG